MDVPMREDGPMDPVRGADDERRATQQSQSPRGEAAQTTRVPSACNAARVPLNDQPAVWAHLHNVSRNLARERASMTNEAYRKMKWITLQCLSCMIEDDVAGLEYYTELGATMRIEGHPDAQRH